jgi:hypothetical protein
LILKSEKMIACKRKNGKKESTEKADARGGKTPKGTRNKVRAAAAERRLCRTFWFCGMAR